MPDDDHRTTLRLSSTLEEASDTVVFEVDMDGGVDIYDLTEQFARGCVAIGYLPESVHRGLTETAGELGWKTAT